MLFPLRSMFTCLIWCDVRVRTFSLSLYLYASLINTLNKILTCSFTFVSLSCVRTFISHTIQLNGCLPQLNRSTDCTLFSLWKIFLTQNNFRLLTAYYISLQCTESFSSFSHSSDWSIKIRMGIKIWNSCLL